MTIKEQDIVLVQEAEDGTKTIQLPITRVENVEGAIKTINGLAPDESGNVVISSTDQATKALKDGNDNVIVDTYATKSALSEKLDKTDQAISAKTALQDSAGNVIVDTYSTKTALQSIKDDIIAALRQLNAL